MRRAAVGSCWVFAVCFGLVMRAQAQTSETPYRLYPALDATAMGVSALVWWTPALLPAGFVATDGCSCSSTSLNGFDRWAVTRYHPGYSIAGELMIAGIYSLAVLLDLADVINAGESAQSFFSDLAVIAEAVLLNGALNQVAKLVVARPRPLLYELPASDPRQRDPDSYLSFYSAHTSSAFAIALAYAQTFAYRHPDSPYRYLVYAAAIAAGSGIGATRIAAGKHFPSDVLVGAVTGAAFGLLIPWLHRRNDRAQLSVIASPDSFGLVLAITAL
jgi:membrane-associated phospholipid phosphatase